MVNFKQLAVLAGVMAASSAATLGTTSRAEAGDASVKYVINENHKDRDSPFIAYQPEEWKKFEDRLKAMSPNELANTLQRYAAWGFEQLKGPTVVDKANGFAKLMTVHDVFASRGVLGEPFRSGNGLKFKNHNLDQFADATYDFMGKNAPNLHECVAAYFRVISPGGKIKADETGTNLISTGLGQKDYDNKKWVCGYVLGLMESTNVIPPGRTSLNYIRKREGDALRNYHLGQELEILAKLHSQTNAAPIVSKEWVPNIYDPNKTEVGMNLTLKHTEQLWTRITNEQYGTIASYFQEANKRERKIEGIPITKLVDGTATVNGASLQRIGWFTYMRSANDNAIGSWSPAPYKKFDAPPVKATGK